MGKFGHHFDVQSPNKSQRSSSKAKKNPMKVTYISSPMKVKASNASEFRAIVQELTGKDSNVNHDYNISDYAELNYQAADPHKKIASPAADEFLTSHLGSVDHQFQFDERFFWREVCAESSLGFQSLNCVSLYD